MHAGGEKPNIAPANHIASVSQTLKRNLAQHLPALCEAILRPLPASEVLVFDFFVV
jgi:hypothetical protein